MKAEASTEAAVRAVLDKLAEAYATRNVDMLLSIFAPDPDVIMYGTGADEKRVGHAEIQRQAERDWSQTESASVSYESLSVSQAGTVAWAAADITFTVVAGGETMSMPARNTAVLEQRGGDWLIVQAHYSFPASEQLAGESFPTP